MIEQDRRVAVEPIRLRKDKVNWHAKHESPCRFDPLEPNRPVLRDQWLITEATWSDSVRQRFEERYLAPLEPAVDSAINGMQKIAEVLDQVRRDCSDRSETS